MPVSTKILHRRDTAANWTSTNPTLAAGELGFETDTLKFKVGDGSTAWTSLKYSQDASLLSGAASLTTLTTSGNVTVGGNLTVNGTTTAINSSTIQVDDKNIELASVATVTGLQATLSGAGIDNTVTLTSGTTSGLLIGQLLTKTSGTGAFGNSGTVYVQSIISSTAFTVGNSSGTDVFHATNGAITFSAGGPTDITATGGGLTVLSDVTANNKTWQWLSTGAWTSNQDIDLSANTKVYKIAGTTVLSNTQVLGFSINASNSASTIVARDASGDVAARRFTSTIATGTSPFVVSSTTVVTNLNADTVDGFDTSQSASANTVAVRNASSWLLATGFSGTTVNVTGQLISTQATGTAPLAVSSTTLVSNLNADLLDGYNTATAATVNTVAVRDANGSLTANVFIGSSANVTGQLISTVATGTAPFSVASTTKVANLNADTLDGYDTATAATANTVAVRDANASVTANVFIGASANVTGQLISTVATGTAPLSVASTTRVTNLNAATAGVADSATIAGQANNITGAANVIFYNGTANTTSQLAYSTANNNQVLTISAGVPAWVTPAAQGVTNVATGTGLTGGPITSTGTISINTAAALTWTATQRVNVSTDSLAFGIRANTTQTANIFEARDGAATMMMSLSNVGTLYAVTIDGGSA